MKNYYEILHIANFAEIEVVRAAYKAMTKLYHPDVNRKADPSVMVEINLAYEVLGDYDKKQNYDKKLKAFIESDRNNCVNENSFTHQNVNKEFHETKSEDKKRRPRTKLEKVAKSIGDVLWFTADAIMDGMRTYQCEVENTYLKGIGYTDLTLVKRYLKSTGAKKQGYCKALVERGLLSKQDGEIVPSYEFKQIARYIGL